MPVASVKGKRIFLNSFLNKSLFSSLQKCDILSKPAAACKKVASDTYNWLKSWSCINMAKKWQFLRFLIPYENHTEHSSNLFWIYALFLLTLWMLRLLSSKAEELKRFWKSSKPCHVGIHLKALAEYSQMSTHLPGFWSFSRFFASYCISQISHQQHKG